MYDLFKECDIYHRHSSVGKNDIICMSLKDVFYGDDVKRGWERTTERSMIGLKHATKVAGNDLVNKVTSTPLRELISNPFLCSTRVVVSTRVAD